jgi:hypothetical protein
MSQDFIVGNMILLVDETTLRTPIIGSQGKFKIEIPVRTTIGTIFHFNVTMQSSRIAVAIGDAVNSLLAMSFAGSNQFFEEMMCF